MDERSPPIVPKILKDARRKPPFEYSSLHEIKGIDPLFYGGTEQQFDWQSLYGSLGEDEDDDKPTERDTQRVGQILGETLRWLVQGNDLIKIGLRAVELNAFLNRKNDRA
jgi:hypothetical protein